MAKQRQGSQADKDASAEARAGGHHAQGPRPAAPRSTRACRRPATSCSPSTPRPAARRDAAPLGSRSTGAAIDEIGRIEVRIADDRAGDGPAARLSRG